LENILYANEISSGDFTVQPAEEEKVRWCGIRAAAQIKGSFESELCHLREIRLGIVGFDIVDMEEYDWSSVCPPSCLKHGENRDGNFLTEISSVE
jgi:hypothetical protein